MILLSSFGPAATAAADDAIGAVRDERLHLNITQERIDRGPYSASLAVGVDRPVLVRVGVALSTDRIIVTLRGVHGDGAFHGDLSRITRVIAAHSGRTIRDGEKE